MESTSSLIKLLKDGAAHYKVELDDSQIDGFLEYKDILKEWNEKINLTAIEDDKDVVLKHFIDSLSILPYLENTDKALIDIGTGAGFPGIPVKIAYKNINVTLLDSLDKRIKFLDEVIKKLKLTDIKTFHSRAEDFGAKNEHREKYDLAVARAVANLPVLLEYCLPFVKVGGSFIAMKGSNTEEIEKSKRALELLGGEIADISEITLPFSDLKRNIILVKKLRHIPTKYPRKAGKPSKDPLI